MKPKILLAADLPADNYGNAVLASGGEPVVYTGAEDPTDFDGLVLCGGGDVDPVFYAEKPCAELIRVDRRRDEREFSLILAFLAAKKPVFGICRGHQVINVFFGGTLVQHLPNHKFHRNPEPERLFDLAHGTTAAPDSFIGRLYGEAFRTNSAHHQAVDRLAPGLRAVQWASDGVIEALAHETLPVWSVQWHPERLRGEFSREDAVSGDPVFAFFLDQCK